MAKIFEPENGCRIKPTPQSESLISRLRNGKFKTAVKLYMKGQPKDVQSCLRALARLYGNSGWIMGDQAVLLGLAVECLAGHEDEV